MPLPDWIRNSRRFVPSRTKMFQVISAFGKKALWGVIISSPLVAMAVVVRYTPPQCWLPDAGEADSLLGTLLTAQAAIAALTLAVTLFVMQGARTRPDADDRMYQEYLQRSWARLIFWGSIYAVGITGLVLLAGDLISGTQAGANYAPGIRNLFLAVALAFTANLALAGFLFQKAVHLSQPGQWRALRQDVNEGDIRQAIQAFLRRSERRFASLEDSEPNFSSVFQDEAEGSADEAVRSLLDDARRAMAERRFGEFTRSLEAVKGLLTYALDEMENGNIRWGPPGSQPEWPPLRELAHSLFPFREEIIQNASPEYILQVLRLDDWLTRTGAQRRCGELFTAGLEGHRRTYQVANRIADREVRETLVSRLSVGTEFLVASDQPDEAFPFTTELVRNRERMLSDAMEAGNPEDYDRFHRSWTRSLQSIHWIWSSERTGPANTPGLAGKLDQHYRTALMGLAGRAIDLSQAGGIDDPSPYLNPARATYGHPQLLAEDASQALMYRQAESFRQWEEWEWRKLEPDGGGSLYAERYPLNFFGLRLLELCRDRVPDLDLHGTAQRAMDWFENNSAQVERFLVDDPETTPEQRRERARSALTAAVRRDEVAEEYEIIGRGLSVERVASFVSGVYAEAFSQDPLEPLFAQAEAFLYLPMDADDAPKERGFYRLEPKGFLAEEPAGARISYAPANGEEWGRGLAQDVVKLLCDVLAHAPEITGPVNTPAELLEAIDTAIEQLDPSGEPLIVLVGDWSTLEIQLAGDVPQEYIPWWFIPEEERLGEMARYRGNPILRGPREDERRLFVVDPATWGCFVRAQCEDEQDLRVQINTVSSERAREHLKANPNLFPAEPDEDSKLRKLQASVELDIAARVEFRVSDASRARQVKSI